MILEEFASNGTPSTRIFTPSPGFELTSAASTVEVSETLDSANLRDTCNHYCRDLREFRQDSDMQDLFSCDSRDLKALMFDVMAGGHE